ncbi:MAG TPA: hypothetical protein ENG80_01075 [Nitrospirae bacterium]|nr:hypothetical protein [Nitrospirota bacterium]
MSNSQAVVPGPLEGSSTPRFLTGVTVFGWIGLYTPFILLLYLVTVRLIFVHEKRAMNAFVKEKIEELKYGDIAKKHVYINFAVNAAVVVLAAILLPEVGASIAEITGLGQTFVGSILIAVSTSLPEIVVSITALKIGASDMAIGNLFGSNIFNIGILAVDDLFFIKGPLLSYIDTTHIVSALAAVIMTTVAIIGLTYRARKKALFISWDAAGIVAVYIFNVITLYVLR